MPQPKDLDPYTDPRSFYGSELRRPREAGGHSQEQLGEQVFCSGAYTGQLVEEPALVAQFRSAYDLARAAALSPEASLALIESAAKDCTTHDHHT